MHSIFLSPMTAMRTKRTLICSLAGILALGFGGTSIRMVTHLDINDDMMKKFEIGIKSI